MIARLKRSRPSPAAAGTALHSPRTPSDPALPLVRARAERKVPRSTRGKTRAAVLVGLHLLIAAHVTHYLVAGRTVSPIEPSESMYTIELGLLNAGFVFFVVSLLATLIFGRFICGWACHIVALQDLCGFLMRKLGIRPRPFRSRLLALGPLLLALYMFVWPTVRRLAAPLVDGPGPLEGLRAWLFAGAGGGFPGFSNHLMTDSFWKTFPGPVFAVLTLATCGFAAVYFLGNKGFCTYGCPYGAFFGAVDRLAPARIRVTDACRQCGHCTAVCTSNVRVHEEVALHRMVVDPGCMKCMDCVSACPSDALYYGWGRPAVLAGAPAREPAPRFTLSRPAELGLAGVALGATMTFRGLYDGPPLLMAIALGALTAFATLKLWQLVRQPTVRVQNLNLKLGGRWSQSGRLAAALTAGWLLFTGHSAYVQWHRSLGSHWLERTEASREEVLAPGFEPGAYSETHERAAARAHRHLSHAAAWGLVPVLDVELGLAWTHLLRGEDTEALARLGAAVAQAPERPERHDQLIAVALSRGRGELAIEALEAKLRGAGAQPADHFRLAGLLVSAGRQEEAVGHYRECLRLAPDSLEARYNLGGLLRRLGQPEAAVIELARAHEQAPGDYDTLVELGLAHMAAGQAREALAALRGAVRLEPSRAESQGHLARLIHRLETETGPEADSRS